LGFTQKKGGRNQGDRSRDSLMLSDHGPVPLIAALADNWGKHKKKGRPLSPYTLLLNE